MSEKIILINEDKIISNDMEVSECFNTYFTNITNSLEIDPVFKIVPEQLPIEKIVMRAFDKYKDHNSICIKKEHFRCENNTFHFAHVIPTEVMRQIELLDKSKSNSGNIPTFRLKET